MIGVGIIGFNRPHYMRRLFMSLEAQTDLHDVDFHLYLDGPVNQSSGIVYAEQKDIDACARMFARAKLPNKWLHTREHNVNIGIASFEATEELTGIYERVMQLEDDLVLSPDWFRLARILYRELEDHPDVYSFSPGFQRMFPKVQDRLHIDRVTYAWHHMWCECFTADRWLRIRDEYMEYHELIVGPDYLERFEGPLKELYARKGMQPMHARSQDGGREMAIRLNGMRRARTAVNRAIGIGLQGIHFNPVVFELMGFTNQTPFFFDEDAARESFEWDE